MFQRSISQHQDVIYVDNNMDNVIDVKQCNEAGRLKYNKAVSSVLLRKLGEVDRRVQACN